MVIISHEERSTMSIFDTNRSFLLICVLRLAIAQAKANPAFVRSEKAEFTTDIGAFILLGWSSGRKETMSGFSVYTCL